MNEEDVLKLSREISALSDEYYKVAVEMAGIAERSGVGWLELRKECKTDAECNKRWDTTADGRRESFLKWYLKGLEKKISSKRMEIRILTGQGA